MRVLATTVAALSCGGGGSGEGRARAGDTLVDTVDVDLSADSALQVDSLVMPPFPEGRGGRLVTASAGRDTLAGSWPVRAGVCAEPPSVQVMSETGEVGTMLLLLLPDSGAATTEYPIHRSDTALGSGEARLAVQLFRASRPAAYEVRRGVATLERLGRRRADGRFTATLRNVTTRDSVFYAGVFRDVPVDSLPPELCATAADTSVAG
jgi:hypothetical protein